MTETYQVLARKYRPETFADLIGQEAMVRTLKNAFAADRIHHAFVMTGIRGTGKTTTARIIAKGLNCIGPDGTGGPTTEPCGVCEPCRAIAEGRHVDVLEMDAASRTGVNDIREIIDSVAYRAASARYKIYIIDEVHMLSNSAFNALLKTLEEPPPHVKFIFATTEIRKVPVTVLSRCQRFDLRRIEPEVMIAHLAKVAGKENAQVAEDALALIARAAEGSVRDAMSLLDQAISHGAGETTADQVRAMLGLADRGRVMDLFEAILRGDVAAALEELAAQYADGADPVAVLRDLAEITHWVSVIKVTPAAAEDPTVSPDERQRGSDLAGRLDLRILARMWQMLLKALEEVAQAPNAMMAAEMAVIRMTHVADLPTPDELIRRLQDNPPPPGPSGGGGGGGVPMGGGVTAMGRGTVSSGGGGAQAALAGAPQALAQFATFERVMELIAERRDIILQTEVKRSLRLVRYSPGRIEFEPTPDAAPDLAARLAGRLQHWTGTRWAVSIAQGGGPTIAEQEAVAKAERDAKALADPLVKAIFEAFPGAKFHDFRPPVETEQEVAESALAEVEDEWDPFED
ncbi:DNA polymerase III subunit gamma/tau [Pararhodobacter sp.]|uniref:DNA polymerase III subunit gamma/tau n=1 Tax=Pararhodobacter sp. TaxID=2127056 RepID=UPI002FDF44FB